MIFPCTLILWKKKDQEQVSTTKEKVLAINEHLKQRLIILFKLLPLVQEMHTALVAEVSTAFNYPGNL